jgi:trans-2-enoyl-CoA reductase
VVFDAHGHPSRVLRVDDAYPVPSLGPDDVLVWFKVSPVNPSDLNAVEGTYPTLPKTFPAVGGSEGVGEVVRFGTNVTVRSFVGGDTGSFGESKDENASASRVLKVIPEVPGVGTWREFAVLPASVLRVIPSRVPDELAAQMCVNLPTALRMLEDFVDLGVDFSGPRTSNPETSARDFVKTVSATVAINAPASAVGRAALQMCKARGVPVVCALRPRETREAWDEDVARLRRLGASAVVRDVGTGCFRSPEARAVLSTLPPVRLALNGVGGESSAALAGVLCEDGVMVTYGGMARVPAYVPTGSAIFKNVTARGFWLSRWNREAGRGFGAGDDARSAMVSKLVAMIDRGELSMPTRGVSFEGFVDDLDSKGKVGRGKTALWTSPASARP